MTITHVIYKHNCEPHPTNPAAFRDKTADYQKQIAPQPGDIIRVLPFHRGFNESDEFTDLAVENFVVELHTEDGHLVSKEWIVVDMPKFTRHTLTVG